jgi:hypothetical protein
MRLRQFCLRAIRVVARHKAAKLTDLGAQTALTKPIHGRFALCLSYPLQRGNGICHLVEFQSLQKNTS